MEHRHRLKHSCLVETNTFHLQICTTCASSKFAHLLTIAISLLLVVLSFSRIMKICQGLQDLVCCLLLHPSILEQAASRKFMEKSRTKGGVNETRRKIHDGASTDRKQGCDLQRTTRLKEKLLQWLQC